MSNHFRVVETSQYADSSGGGAFTVEPGEYQRLVEWEPSTAQAWLLALGATDQDETTYVLRIDHDRAAETRSPFGLVNAPYSFLKELGKVPSAQRKIEYGVEVDENASSPKTLAGRMYVTEEEP